MVAKNKKGFAGTAVLVAGILLVLAAGLFFSNWQPGLTGFAVTQFSVMGVTVESDRASYSCFPSCTAFVNVTNANESLAFYYGYPIPYNVTLFNLVGASGGSINFSSVDEFNGSSWNPITSVGAGSYYVENHPFNLTTYQFRVLIENQEVVSAKWNFTLQVQNGAAAINFTLDPYIDSIVLVSPENGSNVTYQNFTFFFMSSLDSVQNCSLYIDGVVAATNSSVSNGVNTTFTITKSLGNHSWNVGCVNSFDETGFSELRNVSFLSIPYGRDAFEPDDSSSNASWILVDGSAQQHTFSPAGDRDWLKFNASVGSRYLVESFGLSNGADTVITLFGSDASTVLSEDDDGSVEPFASAILFSPKVSGTYFLRVNDWDSGWDNGSYSVRVIEKGHLVPYLISPVSDVSVVQNSSFSISTGVLCVGGVCDDVRATLDPQGVNKKLLALLESEGSARVIVKLRDSNVSVPKKVGKVSVADLRDRLNARKALVASSQDKVLSRLSLDSVGGKKGGRVGVSSGKDFILGKRYSSVNSFSGVISKSGFDKLVNDSDVESIVVDSRVSASLDSSVPVIEANKVWGKQIGGVNVTGAGEVVCIVDTGINYGHADFGGNSSFPNAKVVGGYDFVNSDSDPLDDNGHGSHVAGIVASQDSVYRGVAPGARIVAVKSLDVNGSGWESDIVAGIDWCVANASVFNISVISLSLGDSSSHSVFCEDDSAASSIDAAVSQGILVVVASGNEHLGLGSTPAGVSSPACVGNALSVGAVSDADAVASFTNRDFLLDVLAPGVGITATNYLGGHTSKQGTSMAAPHVSGAAVLLQQYSKLRNNRSLSVSELSHLLKFYGKNVVDSGNTGLSFNRVDVLDSVNGKGDVSTIVGAQPFFTTSLNPFSCGTLASGQSCNYSWVVNATGGVNSSWSFFTIYEGTFDYNITHKFNVTITGALPPVPSLSISVVYPLNGSELVAGTTSTFVNISTNDSAVCRYSLTDENFDFGTGLSFTSSNGTSHSFNFSGLSDGNTYSLFYKCNISGFVNSPGVYHRFSVGVGIALPDSDGDGINDSVDTLLGDSRNVSVAGISLLNISVGGSFNLSQVFSGLQRVEFVADGNLIVSFDYNFSESSLNLSVVSVEKQSSGRGYSLVKGLVLTGGQKKSLFVDRVIGSSRVCVKDAAISSISELSSGCNGANEYLVSCPGSNGSISCSVVGSRFNVSGLSYSGVIEFNGTSLSVWDDTDSMVKFVGQSIGFFANYTNSSGGAINSSCNILFSSSGPYAMNFDGSLYSYFKSFNSSGSFSFNVSCDGLSVSDSFFVSVPSNGTPIVNFGSFVEFFAEDGFNSSLNLSNFVSDSNTPLQDLSWSYSGNDYVNVFVNQSSKIVSFTSDLDWFGSELVTFYASDNNSSGSGVLNVSVLPVNDAPRTSGFVSRFANGLKYFVLSFGG